MHVAEVPWHSSVKVQNSKCEFVRYSSYSLKSKHWFTNGDVCSYYYYYCNILCRLTLTLALNIKKHYPLIPFKRKMNRYKQNKWHTIPIITLIVIWLQLLFRAKGSLGSEMWYKAWLNFSTNWVIKEHTSIPEDLSLEMIDTEMIHAYFMLHTHILTHI